MDIQKKKGAFNALIVNSSGYVRSLVGSAINVSEAIMKLHNSTVALRIGDADKNPFQSNLKEGIEWKMSWMMKLRMLMRSCFGGEEWNW